MHHRVAMVLASPFPAPRGTQAWVSELSRALVELGHEVHLWCYGGARGGGIPDGVVLHRAPRLPGVDPAPGSEPGPARPVNDALLAGRLAADLRRVRPTVVHAHNHEGVLVAATAARLARVPLVYQVHGALAEELPAWLPALGPLVGTAGSLIDHVLPRMVDAVATLDAASARRLARRGVPRPTVLPPGVTRTPPGRRAAQPTLVYIGNLDPYQDVGLLLEAFRRLHTRRHDARLLLVTHDRPGAHLADLEGVEVVRADGFADAAVALRRAWASVLPRRGGAGFPVKLLDSLGAGLPVVATVPAAKGLGHDEGVYRVPPDPDAMAEGFERVLADAALRRRLSAAAGRWAERHPWSAVAESAVALYDRVTGAKGRSAGRAAVPRAASRSAPPTPAR